MRKIKETLKELSAHVLPILPGDIVKKFVGPDPEIGYAGYYSITGLVELGAAIACNEIIKTQPGLNLENLLMIGMSLEGGSRVLYPIWRCNFTNKKVDRPFGSLIIEIPYGGVKYLIKKITGKTKKYS